MPKQNYLCVVRSSSGTCEKPSPAEMEASYAKFNAWKDKFQDSIVDMGGALEPERKIVSSESVLDGPLVEAKEIIGGYMLISAESIDEAVQIVRESPACWSPDTSVEIGACQAP